MIHVDIPCFLISDLHSYVIILSKYNEFIIVALACNNTVIISGLISLAKEYFTSQRLQVIGN